MMILKIDVSKPGCEIVKNYSIKSLGALFSKEFKSLFWPFSYFDNDRRIAKDFGMALKSFLTGPRTKIMKVSLIDMENVVELKKTKSFISLVNYLKGG